MIRVRQEKLNFVYRGVKEKKCGKSFRTYKVYAPVGGHDCSGWMTKDEAKEYARLFNCIALFSGEPAFEIQRVKRDRCL